MGNRQGEGEKPSNIPVHKQPAWLSSEDVHAEIRRLAEEGADKAVCWDMTQAVYGLVAIAHATKDQPHDR